MVLWNMHSLQYTNPLQSSSAFALTNVKKYKFNWFCHTPVKKPKGKLAFSNTFNLFKHLRLMDALLVLRGFEKNMVKSGIELSAL